MKTDDWRMLMFELKQPKISRETRNKMAGLFDVDNDFLGLKRYINEISAIINDISIDELKKIIKGIRKALREYDGKQYMLEAQFAPGFINFGDVCGFVIKNVINNPKHKEIVSFELIENEIKKFKQCETASYEEIVDIMFRCYKKRDWKHFVIKHFQKKFKKIFDNQKIAECFLDGIFANYKELKCEFVNFIKKIELKQARIMIVNISELNRADMMIKDILLTDEAFNNDRIKRLKRAMQKGNLDTDVFNLYVKLIRHIEKTPEQKKDIINSALKQIAEIAGKQMSTIKKKDYSFAKIERMLDKAKESFKKYNEIAIAKRFYKTPIPSIDFPEIVNKMILDYYLLSERSEEKKEVKKLLKIINHLFPHKSIYIDELYIKSYNLANKSMLKYNNTITFFD